MKKSTTNIKNKKIITVLLLVILSLSALASNAIAPITTLIAKDLNSNIKIVVLFVTSYFFGNAFGQIISGNLSDIKGRKKVLIIGITLFILSSGCIGFSNNAFLILLLSFFQGIGGGVLVMVYKSSIFDIYKGNAAQKVFSYLSSLYALINIIAPFVGIYLNDVLGWQYIYITLAAISVVTLVLIVLIFPEIKSSSINSTSFFKNSKKMIFDRTYMIYSAIVLFSYALILFMIALLPILFDTLKYMNNDLLAYAYAGMIVCYMIGNLISTKFVEDYIKTINMTFVMLILVFVCIIMGLYNESSIIVLASIGLSNVVSGILLPLFSGLAIKRFPENRGLASSISGAIQIGGGALIVSILVLVTDLNLVSYACFILFLITLICVFMASRNSPILSKKSYGLRKLKIKN